MKTLLVLILIAFSLSLSSCTRKNAPAREFPPSEVAGMVQNDFVVLVDVREPAETSQGHAPKAISMPWSQIESQGQAWEQFLAKLPKDKSIVTYSSDTNHAKRAADLLSAKGYKAGFMASYQDWVKAGLPVEKTPL